MICACEERGHSLRLTGPCADMGIEPNPTALIACKCGYMPWYRALFLDPKLTLRTVVIDCINSHWHSCPVTCTESAVCQIAGEGSVSPGTRAAALQRLQIVSGEHLDLGNGAVILVIEEEVYVPSHGCAQCNASNWPLCGHSH